ncbi:polyprenyl synthetase family protein [uncultured Bacteroides sp.]|uniref:polyprenyl synthetase family protein n=1 Tax=uncultured Bacteroides sp. TaxID=162156 RepID=UPI0025F8CF26|nr:polyprenyl synthetase family protein [uncultured Bacteroides sp.]
MKQYEDKELLEKIQKYIGEMSYTHEPENLYKPIEYVLGLGGKRIRPVLMLMAYNLYKDDVEKIYQQAAALETYHNFTLLHDDLMDKADMRRNRPTVHKKWDENSAILSGDAMLILSFKMMMESCPAEYISEVTSTFSKAALEVCDGQQWDMDFEKRLDVTVDEYMNMICLKTSVLLAASLKIGAILSGASAEDANLLYDFGIKMGLAFQLQDDYLDVYADSSVFGKNIGGDICSNKKTFMLITALEKSAGNEKDELLKWIEAENFNTEEKIKAVTQIYNNVGVPDICMNKINSLYNEGLEILEKVSVEESLKNNLRQFTGKLMKRVL